ncbi:MAG: ArsA-related P-loop ATPase, partial [Dehalococcoidia bacterium]|nr:ArsA-related P-loop ATPase [Dehalococcoidia bacterium]
QAWLTSILVWRGVDSTVAQEIAILPGMEEPANLLYIQKCFETGEYQAIIVDCAPTGDLAPAQLLGDAPVVDGQGASLGAQGGHGNEAACQAPAGYALS